MLPRVILHNLVSVDGRMDWIKPDLGQYYELAARFGEDATLVGSDTLIKGLQEYQTDEATAVPTETPGAQAAFPKPLLVVPDSRGRVTAWPFVQQQPYWSRPVVLCSHVTPQGYLDYLDSIGIEVLLAGDDHVDLRTALEALHEHFGVKTVRMDSGGTLNGVMLREGLVDEVSVLICPELVGGITHRGLFRAEDLTNDQGVIHLRLMDCERLYNDAVWLRYEVVKA